MLNEDSSEEISICESGIDIRRILFRQSQSREGLGDVDLARRIGVRPEIEARVLWIAIQNVAIEFGHECNGIVDDGGKAEGLAVGLHLG